MIQTIHYKGVNTLAYSDTGNTQGYPILVQHGMIASIRGHLLFHRLIEAGKRVICIARPGYGESSPYQMRNMAEWGEIVLALVEELKLSQFDVLGMSSGAPYSYAIGYWLPEKNRSLFIFSGIPALCDQSIVENWPYEITPDASLSEMQKVAKEVFFPAVTEADLQNDDIKDSMMNDCFGVAQDLRLRGMDWGFKLSDLTQTVYMEHSKDDMNVPLITAELTAKMIPDCRLEIREGEHFSEETLDLFLRNVVLNQ
jgi:pimeloyl-ACP methyl ester carboxylesterase